MPASNPYFDITAPENNIVCDYSISMTPANIKKEMRIEKLYNLLPFYFHCDISSLFTKKLSQDMYDFIQSALSGKKNHAYLKIRTKFSDYDTGKYYKKNRNNVLHAIMSHNLHYMGDQTLSLLKEVIDIAVAQGIHPLEKSMSQGLTPLTLFMKSHFSLIEATVLPLIEYLIALHPDSLLDMAEDKKPALHHLLFDKNNTLKAHSPALITQLIVNKLPDQALESNYEVFQKFLTKLPQRQHHLFQSSRDTLEIRREQYLLAQSVAPQTANKNVSLLKETLPSIFKI